MASPNLRAGSFTVSKSTVAPGESITVSYLLTNIDNGLAGGFWTGIFRSSDSTISNNGSDPFLSGKFTSSLFSGGAIFDNQVVTLTTPGSYWIGAYVDYIGQVPESREDDNASNAVLVTVMTPVPTVSISGTPAVNEGGTLTFTVTRSGGDTSQPLTVFYSTGGQATSGSDYSTPSGSVTIAAGNLTAPITITTIADHFDDSINDETLTLTLAGSSAYNVSTSTATGTIHDVDAPSKPQVTTFAATGVATEGNTLQFRVDLDKAVAQTTTLFYTITGGTAESSDYSSPGSVTINAGSTFGFVNIQTNQDSDTDDETLTLQLNTSSAVDTFNRTATGTIRDDDTVAKPQVTGFSATGVANEGNTLQFRVDLDKAVAQTMTLSYTITGGTAESSDYSSPGSITLNAGSTFGFVNIQTNHDNDTDDETLSLQLNTSSVVDTFNRTATGTIHDVDSNKYIINGFDAATKQSIINNLDDLYNRSPTARVVLDKIDTSHPLTINSGERSESVPGSYSIAISLTEINAFKFYDAIGMLRPLTLEDTLIHETIHAVEGLSDPRFSSNLNAVNADFFGATVQKTNIVMQELGFGYIRSGYINVVPSSFSLTNATFGNSIDFALVDMFKGSYGMDRSSDTINLNSLLIMTDDEDDIVNAGAGRDYIYSGNGNDKLDGGTGSDRLEGGAGDDTYYFSRNSGDDTIFDISGTDTIYYHGDALAVGNPFGGVPFGSSGDLKGGLSGPVQVGNNLLLTFFGNTTITIESYFAPSGANRIERFVDGNEDPTGHGFATNYYFNIGTGHLSGQAGSANYIAAPAGSATSNTLDDGDLSLAQSSVGTADGLSMDALSSVNTADGSLMAMLASASASDDPFDDWLIGADGPDTLIANDGDDVLFGGAGNDQLAGGAGNDMLDGGAGADRLDGGPDTANSGGIGDTALYAFAPSGVSVSLATGSGTRGDAAGDTLIAIENLVGSEYADDLIGNAGTNLLLGLGGDDFLNGGSGADGIDGGLGNDTLNGGPGSDFLDGGAGLDAAIFSGLRSAYSITHVGTDLQVSGPDGLDTLTHIERLIFDDLIVPLASIPHDFDANGHSDILWHNDNGADSIWDNGQIGGAHIIAAAGAVPASWHIAGKGDFDGNGNGDILWQNDSGAVSIWDNGAIGGAHIISAAGVVAAAWHIAGTGDFDGNGHDDILWRNDNGAASIWDDGQIGGAHIISAAGVVSNSWHIAGTGDFDGNGHSDILWRNDNGAASIWDDGQIGGAHIIAAAGVIPSGWNIAGTGDFDGNHHDDILWRNDNGAVSIWDDGQIGGAHIVSAAGVVSTNWHISDTGDFDGNGHSDIVWRNDNGAASIWDDGAIANAHIIASAGDIPAGWHIV